MVRVALYWLISLVSIVDPNRLTHILKFSLDIGFSIVLQKPILERNFYVCLCVNAIKEVFIL